MSRTPLPGTRTKCGAVSVTKAGEVPAANFKYAVVCCCSAVLIVLRRNVCPMQILWEHLAMWNSEIVVVEEFVITKQEYASASLDTMEKAVRRLLFMYKDILWCGNAVSGRSN